jgi:polyferredoxin
MFFGRAVCGWVCPASGIQDWISTINDKEAKGDKLNWIKYFIWVPWIGIIIAVAISSGGLSSINPLHLMENGVSVTNPQSYITFYAVLGIIIILSLTVGKRAFCHYVCWMSPFMIIGTKVKNLLKWPSLHLSPGS